MATGRTVLKHWRAYVDGYDMSGYTRTFGPLEWTHDQNGGDMPALSDAVKGALPGQAHINAGTLSGIFDNTATSGLHVVASGAGVIRNCMFVAGIRAAPDAGDPAFCAQLRQLSYQGEPNDGMVTASIPFAGWDATASTLLYDIPWGYLLHANGAETAANTSGTAQHDHGAQTTKGGYMMYQVLSSNGTVAIKVQDSVDEVNANYSDLLTSGDVDATSTPASGIVALGRTATVERYTRWQIALNTATTVTFALTFVRAYR